MSRISRSAEQFINPGGNKGQKSSILIERFSFSMHPAQDGTWIDYFVRPGEEPLNWNTILVHAGRLRLPGSLGRWHYREVIIPSNLK